MLKSRAPSRNSASVDQRAKTMPSAKRIRDSGDSEYQRLRQESAASTQVPEIAGKLVGIELQNFMCHASLKLEFDARDKNCYYIIGANGSGKSAIFSGLNLGLGGRGRTNDRGNTVQSYIKEGQDTAKIKVVLSNQGLNAHPLYGSEIVVERSIAPTSSSYCLKSRDRAGAPERVVSRKKTDLDKLLVLFNIELDNPLSWLSQDRARQFLQEMKAEKLYEIFTVSTELDSTENIYRQITMHMAEILAQLSTCDKKRAAKQKEFEALVEKFHAGRKIQETKLEYSFLEWKLLWSNIKDVDEKIMEEDTKVERIKQAKAKLENNALKYAEELETARKAKDDHGAKVKQLGKELLQINEDYMREKSKLNTCDRELRDKAAAVEKMRLVLVRSDKELKYTNEQLKRVLGDSNRDIGAEEHLLQQEKKSIEEKVAGFEQKLRELQQQEQRCDEAYTERVSSFERCRGDIANLVNDIERSNREQRTYAAAQKDRLALLGPEIPTIVNLIEENRNKFQHFPLGPIGRYVKLKEAKWAAPVEFCLKGLLNNFVVGSAKDRKTMEQLCRGSGINKMPPIICTEFTDVKHDTRRFEPSSSFLTILRVIDVDNPTVFNVLVDHQNIEAKILVERDDEARRLMRENPPSNVRQTLTMDCGQAYPHLGAREVYRFYANRFDARYLNKDFQLNNRDLKAEQSRLTGLLEHRRQDLSQLVEEKQSSEVALQRAKANVHSLRKQKEECALPLKAIEEKFQELQEVQKSGSLIENFKATLRENTRIRDECSMKVDAQEEEIERKKGEIRDIEAGVDDISGRKQKLAGQIHDIKTEMEQQAQMIVQYEEMNRSNAAKLGKCDIVTERSLERKKNLMESRATHEDNCNTQKDDKVFCQKPPDMTDPPDFDMIPSLNEVQEQIGKMQQLIKKMEENLNSRALVRTEDIKKFKEDKKIFFARHDFFKRIYQRLSQLMEERQHKFSVLMIALPRTLEKSFKEQMSLRGYLGTLDVDHNSRTINIKVSTHKSTGAPDGTQDSMRMDSQGGRRRTGSPTAKSGRRMAQDLKGLSGGERSYTTACFVMALWKCVENPFRCLDEFDVFMDMLNRRMVMEMLVEFAIEHKQNQFVFFTPQSVNELKPHDNIQIFTMQKRD